MRALRLLSRLAGRLALVPFGAALLFLLAGGLPSWSTAAYALSTAGLLIGLATLPDAEVAGFASSGTAEGRRPRRRRPRGMARACTAMLVVVALVRVAVAGTGATMIHDGRFGTSLLGALFDEGDLAQAGSRVLFGAGELVDDAPAVPSAMRDAYARMRDAHGDITSPVVPTFLGLEPAPSGVDMLVLHETREKPRVGVVFLHGLAGSFALPCWTVARAFAEVDPTILTACPSFRVAGDWWSEDGARVLRATMSALRQRGVERFFLVGLSNGGIGLSRLAPRMRADFRDVSGIVLVSGVDPSASGAGVPVLLVHGRHDTMTSHGAAASYARAHGAVLVSLEAGHFAMLVRERAFVDAVRAFAMPKLRSATRVENDEAPPRASAWPEEDALALSATTALVARGQIRDADAPRLVAAMGDAYAEAARERARPDAPVFGVEGELHVVRPKGSPQDALVFLHGYGGRFALPCWRVGRVVAAEGLTTFCPSIGTEGAWGTPEGARVVRATLEAARREGFRRVLLAGLSNGGIGASKLAAGLPIDGLVLLSGVDPAALPARVPTLVVHGTADAMDGVWAAGKDVDAALVAFVRRREPARRGG